MHLRILTLQALGPFVGRHTIDFEKLGASGLYLLEGPTGVGKSTLIDAIVFALYGKVASAEASDDRLRSGFADEDTETFVDLVFETGSGAYRVRRSPEWLRAKKRGAGTTKQQATVKLWRLAGPDAPADPEGGELMSTRLDEAGLEIQRAIGLDRTQFVQTIVLPQGEFASFLRADPEKRRGLLQKVFATGVYERVQDQLVAMRVDAQRAVAAARSGVGAAAAHFVGAAGITDQLSVPLHGIGGVGTDNSEGLELSVVARAIAGVGTDRSEEGGLATASELRVLGDAASTELFPAVCAHVEALAAVALTATIAEAAAGAELTIARAASDAAKTLADAVARREVLRAERVRLLARSAAHTDDVERRDLARRAAVLDSLLTASEAARVAAERSDEQLAAAREQMSDDLAGLDRAGLVAAREGLASQAAVLRRLAELEQTLPERRTKLAAAETLLTRSLAKHAALTADSAARPALRETLLAATESAQEVAAELPALRQREESTRVRHKAAKAADDLATTLVEAGAAAGVALGVAQAAIADEAYLRGRRLAGIAGELAAGLASGEACPVCGAVEHPLAAGLGSDHPTAEQVGAAELARVDAERASAAASGLVTTLTERLAGLREAAGPRTLAEHDDDVRHLAVLVAASVAAQSELAALRSKLSEHDAATEQLRAQTQQLATAVATARVSIEALHADLTADEQEVELARDQAPTVTARVAHLTARVDACDVLALAVDAADRATRDRNIRAAELAAGLATHGFTDADVARAAVLPAPELARLEATVAAHEAALARVAEGLATPALADLPDDVVVDLAGALAEQARAETASTAAGRVAALANRAASSSSEAMAGVEAALATHRTAQDLATPVTRMADLAAASGGDNAKRLTLATYVLVKRFEDVVAAANERLLAMSDGRFELARSDEREDVKSRRTGLSMKVVDHRLEAARDPRTLSGGETFYVSLCLALGMADVVTAEAGGIELGTLFVDEGFGSLDPETLESVLVELGKLRAGGRVVGVVSHVEAMKQSIAERIEVRRLPDGSSTLTVLS